MSLSAPDLLPGLQGHCCVLDELLERARQALPRVTHKLFPMELPIDSVPRLNGITISSFDLDKELPDNCDMFLHSMPLHQLNGSLAKRGLLWPTAILLAANLMANSVVPINSFPVIFLNVTTF